MTFREKIDAIYSRQAPHIRPFSGAAFDNPGPDDLRVMTVGINAYVGEKDWASIKPEWFETWFAQGRFAFQKAVLKDANLLAKALTTPGATFAGHVYRGKDSIFHTNAIKVYLPEDRGKRSDQLSLEDFEPHVGQWYDELDAMAEFGVLPHLIVLFGRPFWDTAWRTFCFPETSRHPHMKVVSYKTGVRDYLCDIVVEGENGPQPLLLIEVRHPASQSDRTVDWLRRQPGFARHCGPEEVVTP